MKRKHLQCGVVMLALFVLARLSYGQTATVEGRITDASEAVVGGAEIIVTNMKTASKRMTVSNEQGYYTIASLPPGEYQVTARMQGFKATTRSGITLHFNQPSNSLTSGTYGRITSALDPRILQFGLKWQF